MYVSHRSFDTIIVVFSLQIVAKYANLPSDSLRWQFEESDITEEQRQNLEELQNILRALRITALLLLTCVIDEDEDNLVAMDTGGDESKK
jgi:hypothetical protein